MGLLIKIFIAFVLDLIFGDPVNITHPVQIIGKLVTFLEKKLYHRKSKVLYGGILNIAVIGATFFLMLCIQKLSEVNTLFTLAEIYLMYTVFSVNSLAREGNRVFGILSSGNIETARKELSYLVSRDTGEMDREMIIRSTMETISENTVDGIIAPMFYMFIGGLPLAMAYKAVNTMDSMLGYKNDRYIDFGKISARVDDAANFIPARITGILIIAASFLLGLDYRNSKKIFFRDRKNHSSLNSAHPEASVAGALGVQFGGKVSYFGKETEKPTIGDKKREFTLNDIKENIRIMYAVSFIGMAVFTGIYGVLKLFGI